MNPLIPGYHHYGELFIFSFFPILLSLWGAVKDLGPFCSCKLLQFWRNWQHIQIRHQKQFISPSNTNISILTPLPWTMRQGRDGIYTVEFDNPIFSSVHIVSLPSLFGHTRNNLRKVKY